MLASTERSPLPHRPSMAREPPPARRATPSIRVPPALAKARLCARMLLQVHDELLFEVPEAELDATAEVVRQVMENACAPALELTVPLVADIGTGPNWAEAH